MYGDVLLYPASYALNKPSLISQRSLAQGQVGKGNEATCLYPVTSNQIPASKLGDYLENIVRDETLISGVSNVMFAFDDNFCV